MYIALDNRPDRMGANLTWYIMQIIYAHNYKYFIHCYDLVFDDSIFIKTVREYCDLYNKQLAIEIGTYDHGSRLYWVQSSEQDWPGNNMFVCNSIQCDLISYFKKHLYTSFREILYKNANNSNVLQQMVENNCLNCLRLTKRIIGVHLRLDDVIDRTDYDGSYCTEYYRNKLNNGNIDINLEEEHEFGKTKNIYIPSWGRYYNPYDPKGEINLPYPCIRSNNIDQDLYYLCNCNVLICSRSLYCFSAVYLGNATEIYIPMWGHIAGTGLTSKFDKNTNLVYW